MTLLKLLLAASLSFSICSPTSGQRTNNTASSKTDANKELVKKIFAEFNKKNLALFDQYFAADVIDHSAFPDQAPGREGLKAAVKGMMDGYPDIKVQTEELLADGDFVVTRDLWNATEKNTGSKKTGWTIHIFKIKNGMIQEEWSKGWEWME